MAVQKVLRKPGQWTVPLREDTPPALLGSLAWFGHIAVVPGAMNPAERGDELLDAARYTGVLTQLTMGDNPSLSGSGMEFWLGDGDGKGAVIQAPGVTLTNATFPEAIRALLPADGSITEGTLYTGITGTYDGTHKFQTNRYAIDYVCDLMGAEWRINGRGRLDAGPAASLFRTVPECVIVRKNTGLDAGLRAIPGKVDTTLDVSTYATDAVVVGQGLALGSADRTAKYFDINGNPVLRTILVDESDDTLAANADARAEAALEQVTTVRRQARLSVDEFDIAGDFEPGDVVWVYDPAAGIADLANEVTFRGQALYPEAVRVTSVTFPVTKGHTVAFRAGDGTWTDLTPWVKWESASGGEVEVADKVSTAFSGTVGSIGTQVPGGGGGMGDAAIPGVPEWVSFTSQSYQPGDGVAKSAMTATWLEPLNTDGSTIVDGSHYEVRYRAVSPTGAGSSPPPSTPVSPTPPTPGSSTGLLAGVSSGDPPENAESFRLWLASKSIGAVATWSDNSVDAQTHGYSLGAGEEYGYFQGIVNLAVGGIFSGDSWANAASGSYVSRWTSALNTIKSKWGSRPPGNLHLRFAHEYNGDFSGWKVTNADIGNYIAAYRRWTDLQRSIIPGSLSCWSPNYGTSSMTSVDASYPGAAYVDVIGPDWYNGWPHYTDAASFTANLNYSPGGNPQGLGAWLTYAASKGKPMCLPEFGNPGVNGDGGGGGDRPGWATGFITWAKANGGNAAGKLWYACYFNISNGYANKFSIHGPSTVQPNTGAVFQANW